MNKPDLSQPLDFRKYPLLPYLHARANSPKIAIETEDESWSYSDVIRAGILIAERMSVQAESGAVGIIGARGAGIVVAILGVLLSGRAFVIFDPKHPQNRLEMCANILNPSFYIVLEDKTGFEPQLKLFKAEKNRILTLPNKKEQMLSYLELLGPLQGVEERTLFNNLRSDALMYIAYTSGSTGAPKAIFGECGPVAHSLFWQQSQFKLGPDEKISMLSGLGHDPLLRDIFLPLSLEAVLCIPPPHCYTMPKALFQWMRTSGVTVCHITPTLATLMLTGLSESDKNGLDMLRIVFLGGEPLKYSLLMKLREYAPNAIFVNCYGATETPQIAAFHVVTQDDLKKHSEIQARNIVPIGSGIDDVQLLVLRPDGDPCKEQELGEIAIRSPYLAREVRNGDGKRAEVFEVNSYTGIATDRLYRSGDLGFYLPNGDVVLKGREDRQIKVRGHRVEPEELERVLCANTTGISYYIDIQFAKDQTARIVVYVLDESGHEVDIQSLREIIIRNLPDYFMPYKIIQVEGFPLTPNGKIDIAKLREMGERQRNLPSTPDMQQPVLDKLIHICEQDFGMDGLSEDDDVASRLNSLQVIEFCCRIEAEFGAELNGDTLIDLKTPVRISDHLSRATQEDARAEEGKLLETIAAAGSVKPTLLPRSENIFVGTRNRVFQILARIAPDVLRVKFHRWRGVNIGIDVSIGYDTIIETSYPWLVRIGDFVNIGMRVTIIGHFRGMVRTDKEAATVDIDDYAFIGPGVLILPNVKIGRAAVIAAGSVVNSSIPPFVLAQGNPAVPVARCGLALSGKTSYQDFLRNIRPLKRSSGD